MIDQGPSPFPMASVKSCHLTSVCGTWCSVPLSLSLRHLPQDCLDLFFCSFLGISAQAGLVLCRVAVESHQFSENNILFSSTGPPKIPQTAFPLLSCPRGFFLLSSGPNLPLSASLRLPWACSLSLSLRN